MHIHKSSQHVRSFSNRLWIFNLSESSGLTFKAVRPARARTHTHTHTRVNARVRCVFVWIVVQEANISLCRIHF